MPGVSENRRLLGSVYPEWINTELQVNRLDPHPAFQSLKKPSLTRLLSSPGSSERFLPPRLDCILQSQARGALGWGGLLRWSHASPVELSVGGVILQDYSDYGDMKARTGVRACSIQLFPPP